MTTNVQADSSIHRLYTRHIVDAAFRGVLSGSALFTQACLRVIMVNIGRAMCRILTDNIDPDQLMLLYTINCLILFCLTRCQCTLINEIHQWIFTKLGMCIDIVEIWFGIANGQISSNFYGVICPRHENGGVL